MVGSTASFVRNINTMASGGPVVVQHGTTNNNDAIGQANRIRRKQRVMTSR